MLPQWVRDIESFRPYLKRHKSVSNVISQSHTIIWAQSHFAIMNFAKIGLFGACYLLLSYTELLAVQGSSTRDNILIWANYIEAGDGEGK